MSFGKQRSNCGVIDHVIDMRSPAHGGQVNIAKCRTTQPYRRRIDKQVDIPEQWRTVQKRPGGQKQDSHQ